MCLILQYQVIFVRNGVCKVFENISGWRRWGRSQKLRNEVFEGDPEATGPAP